MNPIKFLGICERHIEHELFKGEDPETKEVFPITSKDILGLKTIHLSHFFPLNLSDFFFVFCFDTAHPEVMLKSKIEISNAENEVIGTISLISNKQREPLEKEENHEGAALLGIGGMQVFVYKIKEQVIVGEPGQINFTSIVEGERHLIGELHFYYRPAPPLTEERKKAIQSGPHSARAVRMEIGSKLTGENIRIYAALSRKPDLEKEGWKWYKEIPDFFELSKEKKLNLQYIKESFHIFLGNVMRNPSNIEARSQYDSNAILALAKKFGDLLNQDPSENTIQKFIENNNLLLSMFHPELIGKKAPIGSLYQTDFTILNHRGELFLIEIEKSSMKLFTSKKEPSAKITHAFDQVDNWLEYAHENKHGLITNLKIPGLEMKDVKDIRGVVIAGRSYLNQERQPVEKLMRQNKSIIFYTYDDLLNNLYNLARSIANINMTGILK